MHVTKFGMFHGRASMAAFVFAVVLVSVLSYSAMATAALLKPNQTIANYTSLLSYQKSRIRANQTASPASSSSSSISVYKRDKRIVAIARKYLGVPYCWGGSSPSCFDCSGLVQYVYKRVGIHLPRTTWEQWHDKKLKKFAKKSQVTKGSIVFFYESGASPNPAHEGICIDKGCNKMIAAPAPGTVVQIQSLRYIPQCPNAPKNYPPSVLQYCILGYKHYV